MNTNTNKPKLLGIYLDGPCSGRSGIVEVRDRDTGEWNNFIFTDEEMKTPAVMDCEHDGIRAIAITMQAMIEKVKEEAKTDSMINLADMIRKLPRPSDFRYTFVDEEPAGLDAEVTETEDAKALLAKVMGAAS